MLGALVVFIMVYGVYCAEKVRKERAFNRKKFNNKIK